MRTQTKLTIVSVWYSGIRKSALFLIHVPILGLGVGSGSKTLWGSSLDKFPQAGLN